MSTKQHSDINSAAKLAHRLIAANTLYRAGHPFMSDEAFDGLLEELKKLDYQKYEWLIPQLNEGKILSDNENKIAHKYQMGSLKKLQYEDSEGLNKFLVKHIPSNHLFVSGKLDGISAAVIYIAGKFSGIIGRGDGESGPEFTHYLPYISDIPAKITPTENMPFDEVIIRGELIIPNDRFELIKDQFGFKNPRNAVAGIMSRKIDIIIESELWGVISFRAYEIMGAKCGKLKEFEELRAQNFVVPPYFSVLNVVKSKEKTIAYNLNYKAYFDSILEDSKLDAVYDGLVICDAEQFVNDYTKYRPDGQVAIKKNRLFAKTALIDVEWQKTSKTGAFSPVGIIEPVDLGGSTIQRVSLHNMNFISTNGLYIGSEVLVKKAGDIIPQIAEVLNRPADDDAAMKLGLKKIEPPKKCNTCGTKLDLSGNLPICPNYECPDAELGRLVYFLNMTKTKGIKAALLEKLGIKTIQEYLVIDPFPGDKGQSATQTKFIQNRDKSLLGLTLKELYTCLPFVGMNAGKKKLAEVFDALFGDQTIQEIFANIDDEDFIRKRLNGMQNATSKFINELEQGIHRPHKIFKQILKYRMIQLSARLNKQAGITGIDKKFSVFL